jgi:hypothetical protein
MNPMNPFASINPMDFVTAVKPEQWASNATVYARNFLTEIEKQAERWAEYGASQSNEATRLFRTFQTQAFGMGKTIIETTEKTFSKVGQ